eukprot:CAMPEP_0172493426 /NCGR_PEP_ID=MMETSP1066-20121228/24888_1 /TAXON_ID=671091 /ORGANISM="Coscinodiscus wailesii, Strain CCMP2513" /LENGTH=939 /DNA_ID=CAMNT_0013263609 /DNA_START=81 /DNA_END=2900 /DNA_ORIENTATION=+
MSYCSDNDDDIPPSPNNDDENDDDDDAPPTSANPLTEDIDPDTLRILISTDNHLGYYEKDPVRGLDSFAAFEEVLSLARRYKCDMVLLAGDLFHDNKPSRQTLHRTMEILRRYCLGPNPVPLEILSHQSQNFSSSPFPRANYEDDYYSVDLPVFAIHGNHDDPTRDGGPGAGGKGNRPLAALDLLSVANLVNYFGGQSEVDKIEIGPVIIRKGGTTMSLYGLGSVRDERLNRMWQGKKVRFLRPSSDESSSATFFNLFALHQNRDLGRGSKNCVHESMIPEWMDLVVWGHEHECLITPAESLVGTFRVCQPGSSVATSLVPGESTRKHVGVLDVRGEQFRVHPVPLTEVRSFSVGEVSLRSVEGLDPEDPEVDECVMAVLEERVRELIEEAREKDRELKEDADKLNLDLDPFAASGGDKVVEKKYKIEQPGQVLVRLKVEHTGFSTVNNQRFGHRFVSEIANPADVLLFHRRRLGVEDSKKGSPNKRSGAAYPGPLAPEELAEINVEDLVRDNLTTSDSKLEILQDQRMGLALEDFVVKEQRTAIDYTVEDILVHQRKTLVKRGVEEDDNEKAKITSGAGVREVCIKQAEQAREEMMKDDEEQDHTQQSTKKKKAAKTHQTDDASDSDDNDVSMDRSNISTATSQRQHNRRTTTASKQQHQLDSDSDENDNDITRNTTSQRSTATSQRSIATRQNNRRTTTAAARRQKHQLDSDSDESDKGPTPNTRNTTSGRNIRNNRHTATTTSRPKNTAKTKKQQPPPPPDDDISSDDVIEIQPPPSSQRQTRRTTRSTPSTRTKYSYESQNDDDDSDAVIRDDDDDDDDEVMIVQETQPSLPPLARTTRRGRAAATPKKQTKLTDVMSQSSSQQSSISQSRKRRAAAGGGRRTTTATARKKKPLYDDPISDDDDNDSDGGNVIATGTQSGWGSAVTPGPSKRRRR